LNYARTGTKQQFSVFNGGFGGNSTCDFTSTQNIYDVAPFLKVYWELAKKASFTLDTKKQV
jgi:hypothetical protein